MVFFSDLFFVFHFKETSVIILGLLDNPKSYYYLRVVIDNLVISSSIFISFAIELNIFKGFEYYYLDNWESLFWLPQGGNECNAYANENPAYCCVKNRL